MKNTITKKIIFGMYLITPPPSGVWRTVLEIPHICLGVLYNKIHISSSTLIVSVCFFDRRNHMQTKKLLARKPCKVYGVTFAGGINPGTRTGAARGLTANVGTDTQTAQNDFDHIYPWSGRRRCCGYFDVSGAFVANAYEGEPGYTTDGSNGEVWVETPLFFYKHTYGAAIEEIAISAAPADGFLPSPMHVGADGSLRQKAYTAAYPMGIVDGLPTSRSGVYTAALSLNGAMEAARRRGANYATTTAAEQYAKCLLMWVEFATRDMQTVMRGCSTLPYNAAHKAAVSEAGTNRIIIAADNASNFVTGQGIAIGTWAGGTSIANNRTVTALEAYDSENTAICFDGAPVDIAAGNVVTSVPWKTGSCDHVLTSSGSPVSNTSGKYTCVYRGEETPYGNAFEWICDVLFKREGSGTEEEPYSYDIYYLPDAARYANGNVTDDYVKVNYQLPINNGYVKKLGYDARYPWVRIPCEIGATTATYYADYYYSPAYAVTAACVGGHWYNAVYAGPCFWACGSAPVSGYRNLLCAQAEVAEAEGYYLLEETAPPAGVNPEEITDWYEMEEGKIVQRWEVKNMTGNA